GFTSQRGKSERIRRSTMRRAIEAVTQIAVDQSAVNPTFGMREFLDVAGIRSATTTRKAIDCLRYYRFLAVKREGRGRWATVWHLQRGFDPSLPRRYTDPSRTLDRTPPSSHANEDVS